MTTRARFRDILENKIVGIEVSGYGEVPMVNTALRCGFTVHWNGPATR